MLSRLWDSVSLHLICLVCEHLITFPRHTIDLGQPGYGNSSARKVIEDYAQENINVGMLEMLKHTGRDKAVWIGEPKSSPSTPPSQS